METTLDEVLSESQSAASKRRAETFDQLVDGGNRPLVLYGAGGLGRIVLKGLRILGRPPVAFVDRNATTSSDPIDGVPLLRTADAVERFGSEAVFVVTIWNAQTDHRYPITRDELRRLGVRHVAPALALCWKYPETFLPYYCLDVPERVLAADQEVRRLAIELADDESRDVLMRQLRWRLKLDFEALPLPAPGLAYMQPDLLPACSDELFVDCGAFDGDTLRTFLPRMEGTRARVLAIEPDPASYLRLESCAASLPTGVRERVQTLQAAVGRVRETLRFEASGLASAHASNTGAIEVDCLTLDDILAGATPTLIKMDLEGAEIDALLGGEATIRRAAPSMAICVYHRPKHLWEVPLLLRRMLPNHRLHLRPHGHEGWDLVCYAVAPGRT